MEYDVEVTFLLTLASSHVKEAEGWIMIFWDVGEYYAATV